MNRLFTFEGFRFDPETGELIREPIENRPEQDAQASGDLVQRLAPQPAKLLSLLLEHSPDLLSRERIRQELWPDVQVDFDRNLHFCIRQIRAALGESASSSRIIETIPRRGYRIRVEVDVDSNVERKTSTPDNSAAIPEFEPDSKLPSYAPNHLETFGAGPVQHRTDALTRHREPKHFGSVFLLLLIGLPCLTILGAGISSKAVPLASSQVRLGIMPMQFEESNQSWLQSNGLAEQFLDAFTNEPSFPVEVVGPTTTASFASQDDGIRKLSQAYDLDLIINGRHITEGTKEGMLIELIRTSDGAHLWVRKYDQAEDSNAIVKELTRELETCIEESRIQME